MGPGKWSSAEITAHVGEAYRVLIGELGGADGMRLRGSVLQRLSPRQGLELSSRHTRHHAQQLAAVHRSPLPS
jgi:hypothetical protein